MPITGPVTKGVEKIPKREVTVYSLYEDDKGNLFANCYINKGHLRINDVLQIGNTNYRVSNMYINRAQEVPTGVAGEYVKVYLTKTVVKSKGTPVKECWLNQLTNIGHHALALTISQMKGVCHKDVIKSMTINEDAIIDTLAKYGLKAVIEPMKYGVKNAGAITTLFAVSYIAHETFSKISKNCLTKAVIGNRNKCLADAAKKVQMELRSQAAACNEISDPKRRSKCLGDIEKERVKWIKKEAYYRKKALGK